MSDGIKTTVQKSPACRSWITPSRPHRRVLKAFGGQGFILALLLLSGCATKPDAKKPVSIWDLPKRSAPVARSAQADPLAAPVVQDLWLTNFLTPLYDASFSNQWSSIQMSTNLKTWTTIRSNYFGVPAGGTNWLSITGNFSRAFFRAVKQAGFQP